MTKAKPKTQAERVNECLDKRTKALKLFKEAGALLDQIVSNAEKDEKGFMKPITLDDGQQATVLDNFAEKNTATKATFFSRYDLKVSSQSTS